MKKWLWFLRDNRGFVLVNRHPDGGDGGGGDGDGQGGDGQGGDGDAGGDDGGSASAKVDHQTGTGEPQYTPPELDMEKAIPPQYRDKPFLKDLTFEKLIEQHVNLQSKLGQRPTVGAPGPDAKPEEVEAFYNSLRPKEVSEYELPETEYTKQFGKDEKFQEGIKSVFHKAGLSKHQAKLLAEGYDQMAMDLKGAQLKADEEFDQKITDIYGSDKREAVLMTAKNLMKDNIPDDLKPLLDQLDNRALLLLTTTLNSVHDKYIKEDSVGPGNQNATGDPVALRSEAMKIMQSPEYRDFRNPGYDNAQNRVKEIYKQISEIQKGTS